MRDLLEKFRVATFVGMQPQCSIEKLGQLAMARKLCSTFSGTPFSGRLPRHPVVPREGRSTFCKPEVSHGEREIVEDVRFFDHDCVIE